MILEIRGKKQVARIKENDRFFLSFVYYLLPLTSCFLLLVSNSFGGFRDAVGTSGAQFLKLGVNARAIGMGEAYSAVVDGADAIYWNPAGLWRVEGRSLSLMHAVYLQNIYYDFASYAQRVGRIGTFGVGFQYLSGHEMEQVDEFGTAVGSFKPRDMAISFGWAREVKDFSEESRFVLGIAGKLIQSRIIETANAGGVDVGISWNAMERCWMSMVVQNLGTSIKFKEESDDLPVNVKIGGSYRFFDRLILAVDGNIPRDNNPYAGIGMEYEKRIGEDHWIAVRGGYNSRTGVDIDKGLHSVSAGGGIGWRGYGIDFAWVPFGYLGTAYRFSLSAKF